MGIPNLLQYVEHFRRPAGNIPPPGSTAIIDGDGFMYLLRRHVICTACDFSEAVRKEVHYMLHTLRWKVMVFWDGSSPQAKEETSVKRRRRRLRDVHKTNVRTGDTELYIPMLKRQCKEMFEELGCPNHQCWGEADGELAHHVFSHEGSFVLSSDADFFCCGVPFVVHTNCFHLTDTRPPYLWETSAVCDILGGVRIAHLPLIATLLTNDYITHHQVVGFFRNHPIFSNPISPPLTKLPAEPCTDEQECRRHHLVNNTKYYLLGHTLANDGVLEQLLGKETRPDRKQMLAAGEWVQDAILHGGFVPLDVVQESILLFSPWLHNLAEPLVPHAFAQRFSHGYVDCDFADIIVHGEWWLEPVSSHNDGDDYRTWVDVRRRIFAIASGGGVGEEWRPVTAHGNSKEYQCTTLRPQHVEHGGRRLDLSILDTLDTATRQSLAAQLVLDHPTHLPHDATSLFVVLLLASLDLSPTEAAGVVHWISGTEHREGATQEGTHPKAVQVLVALYHLYVTFDLLDLSAPPCPALQTLSVHLHGPSHHTPGTQCIAALAQRDKAGHG
eukprot:Sspe_Gene.70905::Locus_41908_Transcript_1_1_Confidence_1.000_Length_2367::g.70905::m.70905